MSWMGAGSNSVDWPRTAPELRCRNCSACGLNPLIFRRPSMTITAQLRELRRTLAKSRPCWPGTPVAGELDGMLAATCYQCPTHCVFRCGHIIQKVSRAFPRSLLGLGRTARAFHANQCSIRKQRLWTGRQADNLDELLQRVPFPTTRGCRQLTTSKTRSLARKSLDRNSQHGVRRRLL